MRRLSDLPGPLGKSTSRIPWRSAWFRELKPKAVLITDSMPRGLDIVLALLLLTLFSPVLCLRALIGYFQTGQLFLATELVGRYQIPFKRYWFTGSAPGAVLAVLFNILKGDMAFVGPRALTHAQAGAVPPSDLIRFGIRPGLVSTHSLRAQSGIAYEEESTLDRAFFYRETVPGNVGLLARAAIGNLLTGDRQRETPERFSLLGVSIINNRMNEAIDWIVDCARGGVTRQVAFVNSDCLNLACRHKVYREALNAAARVWPDGIGIKLGCRILGIGVRENVNGTDMFPQLCERARDEKLSLYLLGARPQIARLAGENMELRFPGLRIAGTHDGYFTPDDEPGILDEINRSGADILLVAFGAPRQELWLSGHLNQLQPRVCMGVGGLFDFYSGRIPRAPVWMRELGLEWTWRLLQEPGRMWRRYLIGNPLFLYRVYRQKTKSNPA